MSQKKALPFFVVALIGIYCSDPVKIYPVKGVIVDMRPGENIIVVDHDTIPDLMMPMIMPAMAPMMTMSRFMAGCPRTKCKSPVRGPPRSGSWRRDESAGH